MEAKGRQLEALLKEMAGVLVAFSGGVDSSVLLAAAHKALGDSAVAVTGTSALVPAHDLEFARTISSRLGVRWITLESGELDDQHYRDNPSNRCYFCKKSLFTRLVARASEEGLPFVIEGSNTDDLTDIRPGMMALRELGIRSPFLEVGIGKEMIRRLAKHYGLPNWDKPSSACLASRIPYGELITPERLERIDRVKRCCATWDFASCASGTTERSPEWKCCRRKWGGCLKTGCGRPLSPRAKDAGYTFVTLDLQGYRTGAMHEAFV